LVDILENTTIPVWSGCDPYLEAAINAFSEKWRPYSAESRKFSIFSLIRDLIDPAWIDFCKRSPVLNTALMNAAWSSYQWERFRVLKPIDVEDESKSKKIDRAKQAFIPCGGKVKGTYLLSALARHHGFTVFSRFIALMSRAIGENCDDVLSASFDSLLTLASACRSKKSKSRIKPNSKINERRMHLRPACRLCGRPTELSAHKAGTPWPSQDENENLRLSAMYCDVHKPKAPFIDVVGLST
jgi:hypothetical protein